MPIDWSLLAFPKTTKPIVVARATKHRKDKAAWKKTKKAVDERQTVPGEDAPRCFITGKRLQVTNTLDEWTFRDPAHIESRSQSKARANDSNNVLSVSKGVHTLIDRCALILLDKRGREAKSIKAIDHVAWNRRLVAKGAEPCRIRKGLPVVELETVKD